MVEGLWFEHPSIVPLHESQWEAHPPVEDVPVESLHMWMLLRSCFLIFPPSNVSTPPRLSSKIWISALMFSISILCSSTLHCSSISPSNRLLNLSSMATAFLLSLAASLSTDSSSCTHATTSSVRRPSHCICGTLNACSCGSAYEPRRYICIILMPSGSASKRPNTGGWGIRIQVSWS